MEPVNDNEQSLEIDRANAELERILNISLASPSVNNQQDSGQRYCWVCFATDEEDETCNVEWVKPCRCKGTLRWVHQACLQRWIDEKQKGNAFRRVECQQCKTEYIIALPNMGLLADVLEAIDTLIRRSSPFIAAGVFVGSLYWTAVTYGAITVLQVLGHDEGLNVLERTDHIFLMFALPAIPVCLGLGRMIRWEDYILRQLQNRQRKSYRLLSLFLPIPEDELSQQNNDNVAARTNISDTLSTTRVLCGALLLPSISSFIGKVFFSNVQNNLHRTLLGGLSFIVVKGVMKIYFKQKQFTRKRHRKIVDFSEENRYNYGFDDSTSSEHMFD